MAAYIMTICMDYGEKEIELSDKKVKLMIWDMSGDERYREMNEPHFKAAKGALICYDITDASTFENVKTKWVPELKELMGEDLKIALIGLKSDLESKRTVTTEQGSDLASELNCPFLETTSKESNGTTEAFMALANLL